MPQSMNHSTNNVGSSSRTDGKRDEWTLLKSADHSHESIWKSLVIGSFFIVVSIGTLIIPPTEIYKKQKLTLKRGQESTELWMEPNVDIIMKVHLFNVTNKDAFLSGAEKLRLQEVGPFVYKVKYVFENPIFDSNEGTVTVTPIYNFEWVPHLNTRNETDLLTLPNIAMLINVATLHDSMTMVKMAVNAILKQMDAEPIIEQTVKNYLFGQESIFLKMASKFLRTEMELDEAGALNMAFRSKDKTLTFYTGEKDFETSGMLAKLNNLSRISQWDSPCDTLADMTDGKKFGNRIKLGQKLHVYHRMVCRPISLIQDGEPTYSSQGIPTVPYSSSDEFIDNGQKDPANKCFCTANRCLPYGMADVSPCYLGFSAAMSYPHFYKADPTILQKLDGLKPNKTLHESRVFINLETGTATSTALRLQSNIVLEDVSDFYRCERFSNMMLPVMWIEGADYSFTSRTDVPSTVPSIDQKDCAEEWLHVDVFNGFAWGDGSRDIKNNILEKGRMLEVNGIGTHNVVNKLITSEDENKIY